MMICASRRTDIPAFHADWFMNRLRAGRVLVRNPVRNDVVYDVSLRREDVDCIMFVTKDPRPLERHLDEILEMGHQLLFQVTINPYGSDMEPNVPPYEEIANSFVRISERIGKERMLWRYDPVIFSDRYDIGFHERSLAHISDILRGHTDRCTYSHLTYYEKLSGRYADGTLREVTKDEKEDFARTVAGILGPKGIAATTCCTAEDMSAFGVERRACTDAILMKSLGIPFERQQVPYREGCTCVRSVDIGAYDTCMHGCVYCYANARDGTRRSGNVYDPEGEMLLGRVGEDDTVKRLSGRRNARITDY